MKGLMNDHLIYVEGHRSLKTNPYFLTKAEFDKEELEPEYNECLSAGDVEDDFKEKSRYFES
jgi:hypothetical protein